jgi:hypothetical protein
MKTPNFKEHKKSVRLLQVYLDSNFRYLAENFEKGLKTIIKHEVISFTEEDSGTDKFRLVFDFTSNHPGLKEEDRCQKFQVSSDGKYIFLQKHIGHDIHSPIRNPVVIPHTIKRWRNTDSFKKGFWSALKKYFADKAMKRVLKKKKRK